MDSVRSLEDRGLKLSAILVHYHTPELARAAVGALRRDAESSSLDLEVILVDNGSNDEARADLEDLDTRYLEAGDNLGYAGGANLGIAAATGDAFIVLNPDVAVLDGCLGALAACLAEGTPAAGPRFFLDPTRNWLQPPADRRTLAAELREISARAGIATGSALRAWRRRAHRFWSTDQPLPMRELSGALLAIRRDAWEAVGPMDTAFRLYFEETDWLLRLAKKAGRARFVPAATAVHLWGQSTRYEARSAGWFEASARRFRRRWYGAFASRLLEAAAAATANRRRRFEGQAQPRPSSAIESAAWLELSQQACGFPAAGHRLVPKQYESLPPPDHLDASDLVLRHVDRQCRDV